MFVAQASAGHRHEHAPTALHNPPSPQHTPAEPSPAHPTHPTLTQHPPPASVAQASAGLRPCRWRTPTPLYPLQSTLYAWDTPLTPVRRPRQDLDPNAPMMEEEMMEWLDPDLNDLDQQYGTNIN